MRNDLYVGALVALGAHAALALMSPEKRPPLVAPLVDPVIEVVPWTPNPAEPEPEPLSGESSEPKENTVVAPRLPDPPTVAPVGSFTMPPTTVPLGARIDPGVVTIPAVGSKHGQGSGGVVDLALLDRAPSPRFQARPQYPYDMRRGGISGQVLVEFVVGADGVVRDAYAVRSSQREFEAAAVQAVSKWTFRPGQKGGRNVATRMQVPIVFNLNDDRG